MGVEVDDALRLVLAAEQRAVRTRVERRVSRLAGKQQQRLQGGSTGQSTEGGGGGMGAEVSTETRQFTIYIISIIAQSFSEL